MSEKNTNDLYEAALSSHKKHGYDLKVFRNPMVEVYWRKPAYLLSLMVEELSKPVESRIEWLCWVGPDFILTNPQIPLEIFLPPEDFGHIHFLGTHDHNNFDSSVFFIRVHEWSARLLVEVLAFPQLHTAILQANNKGDKAFEAVLKDEKNVDHVLYQPRAWYNAYQMNMSDFKGGRGDVFVHFSGSGADRWSAMADALDQLSRNKRFWSVALEKTSYVREIREYWDRLRLSYTMLNQAAARIAEEPVEKAFRRVQYATRFEADKVHVMDEALEGAKGVFGNQ